MDRVLDEIVPQEKQDSDGIVFTDEQLRELMLELLGTGRCLSVLTHHNKRYAESTKLLRL